MVIAAMKFKDTPWKESYDQPAAAVAAKSLQARLTLCDPIGSTPPGSPSLDSILKSRGITSPAKVHLVMIIVFPVVMYGCESWIVMYGCEES